MRIVVQRAKQASVRVANEVVGQIENGYVLFVGITHDDSEADAEYLAEKIVHLRVFDDEQGRMNRSLLDVEGVVLSVSQFTLYGDCRKGRRPNFTDAAKSDVAKPLYEYFNSLLREKGVLVKTGVFGAKMEVVLTNDGPVTLLLESPRKKD